MIVFELARDTLTTNETVGILTFNGKKFHTIERPWIPNKAGGKGGEKFVSCVGAGLYRLTRHTRPSGEWSLMLTAPELDVYALPSDVPRGREDQCRTLCLIHAANWAHEVNGCIGPGKDRIKQPGQWMVTESRGSMNELRAAVGTDLDLQLRISQ